MRPQVDIFDDAVWLHFVNIDGTPNCLRGPYYNIVIANEALIILLKKGMCAWLSQKTPDDYRKTKLWVYDED